MRESIQNRAAAIRQYLDNQDDLAADAASNPPVLGHGCAVGSDAPADRQGKGTAADDRRFAELSDVLKTLSETRRTGWRVNDAWRVLSA